MDVGIVAGFMAKMKVILLENQGISFTSLGLDQSEGGTHA
jgi:hypothetical protein